MKKQGFSILLAIVLFSCIQKTEVKDKEIVTPTIKKTLIAELKQMQEDDQSKRLYISNGRLNQTLIDSLKKLTVLEQIKFQQSHTSELSKAQEDSLWSLQNKIDFRNTNRLHEIVKNYGWLSKNRLDSLIDPMVFLFHTPKETIDSMKALLFD